MASDDREVIRGAYFELPFLLKARKTGDALVISTWEFAADFVTAPGETPSIETTTTDGHWVVNATDDGRVKLVLTEAQTAALPLGRLQADWFRTDSSRRIRLASIFLPVRDEF